MLKRLASLIRRSPSTTPSGDPSRPGDFFGHVYESNFWGGQSSRSGLGSEGAFAQQKIAIIKDIATNFGAATILDLGCGDFYWMRELTPHFRRYHGVDIVDALIGSNRSRFGSERVSFQCLDLSDPRQHELLAMRDADLIVCLDVFGHLLNSEVDSLLRLILHGLNGKLFLVTNRREPGSADYLRREKTRHEGIDLEQHPLFVKHGPRRVKQVPGLYPNDFFDLYDLGRARVELGEGVG